LPIPTVTLGTLPISRLILGGNPFSGNSHQSPAVDREMISFFTTAKIKEILRQAESLGIDTLLARADRHIMRVLREYWDEGGRIQWIAQSAPEYGSLRANVGQAIAAGARAVYLHGGQMDFFCANGQTDHLPEVIEQIHQASLPAGVAAHTPATHLWAAEHLAVDFHMCSYYNPSPRDRHAEHRAAEAEVYDPADRDAMTAILPMLKKPAIHYKIFAAGRNDPRVAFQYAGQHLRPGDAVCIGVYPQHKPDMLAEDVRLFTENI
jgi:hypothetical protein